VVLDGFEKTFHCYGIPLVFAGHAGGNGGVVKAGFYQIEQGRKGKNRKSGKEYDGYY
jgi:hypothetical protein